MPTYTRLCCLAESIQVMVVLSFTQKLTKRKKKKIKVKSAMGDGHLMACSPSVNNLHTENIHTHTHVQTHKSNQRMTSDYIRSDVIGPSVIVSSFVYSPATSIRCPYVLCVCVWVDICWSRWSFVIFLRPYTSAGMRAKLNLIFNLLFSHITKRCRQKVNRIK